VKHVDEARFPKATDIFAFKFHGLFFVGPAQDAYMCRLRLPGGILTSHQFRGIAAIADEWGGGYADVTTRANLQIREIGAANGVNVVTALQDLGILIRGSGADNIRNVTGSPTAGIDPQELIDTRPLARPCTTTSFTTARCTACRGSSTSPSTAAGPSAPSKTRTTSAYCRSHRRGQGRCIRAFTSACNSAASAGTRTSPRTRASC